MHSHIITLPRRAGFVTSILEAKRADILRAVRIIPSQYTRDILLELFLSEFELIVGLDNSPNRLLNLFDSLLGIFWLFLLLLGDWLWLVDGGRFLTMSWIIIVTVS